MASKPMQETKSQHALTFVDQDGPDVVALRGAYDRTLSELSTYFNQCISSSDNRRCYWPGKSTDMRKHGADAFPWEGASDTEARIIDERINNYVSLFMSSLARANIRAYPTEHSDTGRARVVSAFLKWMVASYIPRFRQEMELGANYFLERGLMITYIGWERMEKKYLQKIDLNQIAVSSPDLARLIIEGKNDDDIIKMFKSVYPDLVDKRAKKALKELREKGVGEIPVSRLSVDRPFLQTCAPDGDVFFPSYCIDPQRAPFVFYRTFLSVQEVLSRVTSDGWDESWAEYICSKYRGVNTYNLESVYGTRGLSYGRYRQQVMVQRFLTPVWGYVIGCAIKDGFLRSTEAWTNVTWTTPRKVTVDAGRDAQQNRMDIESGLKTLTENYLEEGQDPKEQMRANAAEKRYLLDLSKEFDVPLSMLYKPQNVAPADINASVGEEQKQTYMDDGDKVVVDDADPDDEETSKE